MKRRTIVALGLVAICFTVGIAVGETILERVAEPEAAAGVIVDLHNLVLLAQGGPG